MEYQMSLPRSRVRTPALLLDVEVLEANMSAMATRARSLGVALRPHAKSHKCIEIARRLCTAGALGASCATPGEAEALAAGGISGILITSPISTADALARIQRLLLRGADLMLVADHLDQVGQYAAIAIQAERRLFVLVDLDVGLGRTGCVEVSDALAVAKRIVKCSSLRFGGVQAYWGNLQHIASFDERKRRVEPQAQRLASLIAALTDNGLKPEIVTGGGTGTHWIDGQTGLFTELQPGSFLFLDSCYAPIELSPEPTPFRPSLFVAAAVVSANRSDRVIVNAGIKAIASDSGKPVPLRGAPANATYRFLGDEHGAIEFTTGPRPALGSVIELLTSHCDPTVNLYAQYHVVQGETIVDEWTIAARGY
jgi:D-serine deaminase-like pyridoxal phosphate-dependent protein